MDMWSPKVGDKVRRNSYGVNKHFPEGIEGVITEANTTTVTVHLSNPNLLIDKHTNYSVEGFILRYTLINDKVAAPVISNKPLVKIEKLSLCMLCGHKGDDLVFKFYCSNNECRNYHP